MIGTTEAIIAFEAIILLIIFQILPIIVNHTWYANISLIGTRQAAMKGSLLWTSQKKDMLKVKSQKKNLKK